MIQTEALQIIQTVAHFGNFTTAAKHLHKVPSAISYTVKKTEEQLGVQLFLRDSRKVQLTPAGRYFVERSEKLLNELNLLASTTSQIATGVETELHIVVDNIVNQGMVQSLAAAFLEKFPQTRLNITSEVYIGCWDALFHNRCQLAIGAPVTIPEEINNSSKLSWRTMGPLNWKMVMSPEHPLAQDLASPITDRELAEHTTIVVEDSSRILHQGGDSLAKHGQSKLVVPDFRQALACTRSGLGISMTPAHFAQHLIESGKLVSRPVDNLPYNKTCLLAWNTEHIGAGLQWCLDWLGDETQLTRQWLSHRPGCAAIDIS